MYLGDATWDLPDDTLTGPADVVAEQLLALAGDGVNQLQVRFRSRGASELCDQITAFGAQVLPLVDTV